MPVRKNFFVFLPLSSNLIKPSISLDGSLILHDGFCGIDFGSLLVTVSWVHGMTLYLRKLAYVLALRFAQHLL